MLFTTAPLVITDHPADSVHCCGQTRLGYRWIVLHATGGVDSLNWLSTTSPDNNPVSCHRLISKTGKIYKIVSDEKTAYTQGPAEIGPLPSQMQNANNWSLSIELENLNNGTDPYPPAQITACVNQVAEWIGAYGFIPIAAHAWIQANKTDPAGFDWPDFYVRLWAKLRSIARQ
jgi:N-acetyl-anhydromuramyl-L-alanine amidase AmpD